MMLAFLGAEVIKVESSTRLDITRRTQPFPPEMASGVNRSGYFACLNQAKKSHRHQSVPAPGPGTRQTTGEAL